MRRTRKSFILSIGIFLASSALGQNDFGAWTGADISAKVYKDLKAGFEIQSRFSRNLSRMDEVFLSPFLKYDINQFIRIGTDYRYTNSIGTVNDAHRICFDTEARKLMDLIKEGSRFNFSFRTRFTHEYQKTKRNDNYLRFKFDFDYNLPKTKLKPELGAEFFYHFADQITYTFTDVTSRGRMNKYRLKLGASYPLSKEMDISLFYLIQSRFQESKTDYIVGLGYSYNLGKIKLKK